MKHITILSGLIGILLLNSATADEWGTFKGRFTFDGKAPAPLPLNAKMPLGFCGNPKLLSEELVVNPKNNGVKNVIVYLYVGKNDQKPQVHPMVLKHLPKQVRIDNKGCRFDPHIQPMTVAQELIIGNLDMSAHAAKLDPINPLNAGISPLIPANKTFAHRFQAEERLPTTISCGIHPWMKGFVFVRDTPYFAVSDENGEFEIENLPAGQWTFRCWQEKVGYVQKVTVARKATTWKRGAVQVTIQKDKPFELNASSKF